MQSNQFYISHKPTLPVNNWTLPFLIPLLIPNNGQDTSGLQTAFSASQEMTTFQEEYFRKKLQ